MGSNPDRTGYGVADVIAFLPVPSHPFTHVDGMGGGVYLHVRRYQNIVTYHDTVIVHECAVHIDDDLVTHKDIFPYSQ